MALSGEDKKDVQGAMGKALANKVSKATRDKPTARAQHRKDLKNVFKHYSKMDSAGLEKSKQQIHDVEKNHGISYNKNHMKSIDYHSKALANKKGGAISRGATGTLDTKEAERRIKKTGSVL